jgi:WD40 repeat protein
LFGSVKSHVTIWSVEKKEMIRDWPLGGAVFDMKFSEDYRYLAVYPADQNLLIRVYDYSNQKEIHYFRGVGSSTLGEPKPMTFFNGSRSFAFAKKDQLCVYDTQTWKEKWCVSSSAGVKD